MTSPMTRPNQAVELRECPFCGERLEHSPDLSNRSAQAFVHPARGEQCVQEGIILWSDTPDRIAAWNRRASAVPAGEAVAWRYSSRQYFGGWLYQDTAPTPAQMADPYIAWEPLFAHPAQGEGCDWRPIETALRNGDDILACDDETGERCVSYWTGAHWSGPNGFKPTHWMPLLPPPSTDSLGGDEAATPRSAPSCTYCRMGAPELCRCPAPSQVGTEAEGMREALVVAKNMADNAVYNLNQAGLTSETATCERAFQDIYNVLSNALSALQSGTDQ